MDQIKIFEYFVNLDERGEFYADIRPRGSSDSIIEIDTEYAQFLTDERVNIRSLVSLERYYKQLGDLPARSILVAGNGIGC